MTAFICESLQGQLSVVISARERRPQGGSGLGGLQVSAILGCNCLRHQDLTLRGMKRKEKYIQHGNADKEVSKITDETGKSKHTQRASCCRTSCCSLLYTYGWKVEGWARQVLIKKSPQAFLKKNVLKFQHPQTGQDF